MGLACRPYTGTTFCSHTQWPLKQISACQNCIALRIQLVAFFPSHPLQQLLLARLALCEGLSVQLASLLWLILLGMAHASWACRQSAKSGPSILVIRDGGRHVFGSFCSEGWKVSSRYYGTGESFVFQIQVGHNLPQEIPIDFDHSFCINTI